MQKSSIKYYKKMGYTGEPWQETKERLRKKRTRHPKLKNSGRKLAD